MLSETDRGVRSLQEGSQGQTQFNGLEVVGCLSIPYAGIWVFSLVQNLSFAVLHASLRKALFCKLYRILARSGVRFTDRML